MLTPTVNRFSGPIDARHRPQNSWAFGYRLYGEQAEGVGSEGRPEGTEIGQWYTRLQRRVFDLYMGSAIRGLLRAWLAKLRKRGI